MQLKILAVSDYWLIRTTEGEEELKGKVRYSRATNSALFTLADEKASLKIRRLDESLILSFYHESTRVKTILPNKRISSRSIIWNIVGRENEGVKIVMKNHSQKIFYQNECIAKLKVISEKKAILDLFSLTALPPIILLGVLTPTFFQFQ
ncbi:MAG: hypothetical protein GF308_02110 [Candidatus Heimdallarchaeota archaeon]|nr:hypothetical protein [Candidatus Heimdallarchaeota archaeon]